MTADTTFVPVVDRYHQLWWLDPQGYVRSSSDEPGDARVAEGAEWRRLGYQQPDSVEASRALCPACSGECGVHVCEAIS